MESSKVAISTGNPQVDGILQGGFPANSINVIMGQPGTGKTVFAEQMIFHHAKAGDRPVAYLSTLSEPVAKLLTYLERFAFYDERKIGDCVHYRDIGAELAKDGIDVLPTVVETLIHELSPKILVIDSFRALHDLSESHQQMRRMLHKLTGLLTAFETTVFLIGEYTDDQARVFPEFAIADGIMQFMRKLESNRDERFMRVLKLRGSGYLEGFHGCRITSGGMEVFPRLVTPDTPESYELDEVRRPSGVDGLDATIGGGFLQGSSTLVAGATGSGKTTLGLQFALEGVKKKEGKSIVLNFQENPTQLRRTVTHLTGRETSIDGLDLIYISPVEMQIDSVIISLFNRIQTENISRIVVDAVGDLAMAASDSERLHDYLYALTQHFAVRKVTSVLTFETSGGLTDGGHVSSIGRLSYMSDNIISLEINRTSKIRRELVCLKARGTKHDLDTHEFTISASGLALS